MPFRLGILVHATVVVTAIVVSACASAGSGRAAGMLTTRQPAPPCIGRISADTTRHMPVMVDPKPVLHQMPSRIPPREITADSRLHEAVLQFSISATGVVDTSSVEVVTSTDDTTRDFAIAVLLGSSYWPGCRNGEAVAVKGLQQPFRYGSPSAVGKP